MVMQRNSFMASSSSPDQRLVRRWRAMRGARGARVLIALSALVGVLLGGMGGVDPVAAATVTVAIEDGGYLPSAMTVPEGTRVVWINREPEAHTATSDSGLWDSGVIAPGGTYSFTFTRPGTFAYHCAIDSARHGSITVIAAPDGVASEADAATAVIPKGLPRAGGGGAQEANHRPVALILSALAMLLALGAINLIAARHARR
jgi:plastocyanin